MKIATYNVNGINGRLPVLLEWLKREQPDIVCLQELKTTDDRFPQGPIEALGYHAIWHGEARWNGVALLCRGSEVVETRRGLPGDPNDRQSRYIEGAAKGVLIAGFYLPNGNPRPGPKFDYKLAWIDRLVKHAGELTESGAPVALIGDWNIIPTDFDVYVPERWRDDALFAPEARRKFAQLLERGWVDTIRHLHPDQPTYTFWKYWRNSFERDAGLRLDHLLLNKKLAKGLKAAGVDRWVRGLPKTSDHAPVWVEIDNKILR